MTIRRQSKKATRTSFDERLKAAAEMVAKLENVIEVTPAASGALKLQTESAFQLLKIAVREYRFTKLYFFQ